jgi:hypothetical protein
VKQIPRAAPRRRTLKAPGGITKANRAIDATPEPFERYLSEWMSVRRIKLDAGEEASPYEKRDYSQLYRSGEK